MNKQIEKFLYQLEPSYIYSTSQPTLFPINLDEIDYKLSSNESVNLIRKQIEEIEDLDLGDFIEDNDGVTWMNWDGDDDIDADDWQTDVDEIGDYCEELAEVVFDYELDEDRYYKYDGLLCEYLTQKVKEYITNNT